MNISREDKLEVVVSGPELLAALRKQFPDEFLLNQFPASAEGVVAEPMGNGLRLRYVRKVPNAALSTRRLADMSETA